MIVIMLWGAWFLVHQHCCVADIRSSSRSNLVDHLMRRSPLEKNFMRYGRSWSPPTSIPSSMWQLDEKMDKPKNNWKTGRDIIRLGRSNLAPLEGYKELKRDYEALDPKMRYKRQQRPLYYSTPIFTVDSIVLSFLNKIGRIETVPSYAPSSGGDNGLSQVGISQSKKKDKLLNTIRQRRSNSNTAKVRSRPGNYQESDQMNFHENGNDSELDQAFNDDPLNDEEVENDLLIAEAEVPEPVQTTSSDDAYGRTVPPCKPCFDWQLSTVDVHEPSNPEIFELERNDPNQQINHTQLGSNNHIRLG